jgi:hypothetical protein
MPAMTGILFFKTPHNKISFFSLIIFVNMVRKINN